jgi:hypothetical protein
MNGTYEPFQHGNMAILIDTNVIDEKASFNRNCGRLDHDKAGAARAGLA